MKIAWIQILISLIIGGLLGFNYNNFNPTKGCKNCWQKCHQSEGRDDCHGCAKSCKKKCMLEKLSRKLDLTQEQKTKVSVILDDKHKKMMEFKKELEPKFKELHNTANLEIKKVLTEEQQPKFDEIQAKWDKKKKERW